MEKNSYELTDEQISRIRAIGKLTVMEATGWSISTFHRVVAGIPLSQKVHEAAIRLLADEETGPGLLPCVTCGNTFDDPGGCFDCKGEEKEQTWFPLQEPEGVKISLDGVQTCYLCGRICQPYAALIDDKLRFVCRRGCPQDPPKEQGAQPFSKDDWHKISELVKREVDANMSLLAKVEGML